MTIHNVMEELVKDCLKEYLVRKPEVETLLDDGMKSDIMAIVLNRLPPKYVSTEKGEMFSKTQLRVKHESDVFRELSLAVNKVLDTDRAKDF